MDVFAIGPYNADHVAAVYTEDVNYQAADGQWKDLPELAPDEYGWSASVQGVTTRFPAVLSAATPVCSAPAFGSTRYESAGSG